MSQLWVMCLLTETLLTNTTLILDAVLVVVVVVGAAGDSWMLKSASAARSVNGLTKRMC